MPTLTTVFLGAVLPGIVATLLLVAGWRAWRREVPEGEARRGAFVGPLALVAAYLVGHLAIVGVPPVPPKESKQWLPLLAPLVAAAALFVDWLRGCPQGRIAGSFVAPLLLGVVIVLLLRPVVANPYPYEKVDVWLQARPVVGIGAIALVAGALLAGLEGATARARRGTGAAALLMVWAAIAAAAAGEGGSFAFAMTFGALSAGAGAIAFVSLWAPRVGFVGGAVAVWWTLAAAHLVAAVFFATVPWWSALGLALAPQALWAAAPRRLGGLDGWKGCLVAGVLMAAVAAGSVAPAVLTARGGNSTAGSGAGGYGYGY